MLVTLKTIGEPIGEPLNPSMIECIGPSFGLKDIPYNLLDYITEDFTAYMKSGGYDFQLRQNMEKYHYAKLLNSLIHSFGENFYYLREPVGKTRRVLATSTDCISVIQVLIRNRNAHILTYFRSSHYHNLLPVDLIFLFKLLPLYIEGVDHLMKTLGEGEKLTVDNVSFTFNFGSLHTHTNRL